MPSMDHYDEIAAILRMVDCVNVQAESADLLIDGATYAVTPQFCAACGAAADEDCPHKAITRFVVQEAEALQEMERMADYAEAQIDGRP